MAEAADGEKVMSQREKQQRMGDEATRMLGARLHDILERLSPEERLGMLMRLACSLACMSVAQHRRETGQDLDDKELFYSHAGDYAASILMDLMPPLRGEDYKVEFQLDDEVKADPVAMAALTEKIAEVRQALDGVATGKFESVEEAMATIGELVQIDLKDRDTLQ